MSRVCAAEASRGHGSRSRERRRVQDPQSRDCRVSPRKSDTATPARSAQASSSTKFLACVRRGIPTSASQRSRQTCAVRGTQWPIVDARIASGCAGTASAKSPSRVPFLDEMATQMTQQNGGHILQRVKRRPGHRNKSQLQCGADPMSRSESSADTAPVSDVEGKPLPQLEFAEALRKIMPANVG